MNIVLSFNYEQTMIIISKFLQKITYEEKRNSKKLRRKCLPFLMLSLHKLLEIGSNLFFLIIINISFKKAPKKEWA